MKSSLYILIAAFLPASLWASTINGKVLRASDSTAVGSAIISLSGGALGTGVTRSKITGGGGNYSFDSVAAASGYSINVYAGGYAIASVGNITVDSNPTVNLAPIYLLRTTGFISGIVRRSDSTVKTLAGVKIAFYVNGDPVDSVFSDSTGHFLDSLNGATYTVKASLAGYRSPAGKISLDTAIMMTNNQTSTLNLTLTPAALIKTSIIGRVLKASDSMPIVGATVDLPGGPLDDDWRIAYTDSTGSFLFSDLSNAFHSRTISIYFPGYAAVSIGNILVDSNTIVTVPTFYLVRNLGTIAGIVRRADSTTKIIVGAKLVFSINGIKVDSAISDSQGNYSKQLNAATYTLKTSAAGYRGYKGTLTLDTSVVVSFGTTTNSEVFLTPATGTIKGSLNLSSGLCGLAVSNARVYLERQRGTTAGSNNWILNDSTTSDATGFYQFTGLIPATGGTGNPPAFPPVYTVSDTNPNGNYRILANSHSYSTNYDTMNILTSPYPNQVFNLAYAKNSVTTANIILNGPVLAKSAMSACSAIHPIDPGLLNLINEPRVIDVYDLNGKFRHRVIIPAGETKAYLPGLSEESLFLTK